MRKKLEIVIDYSNEISQIDNENAVARLWIQSNSIVYKEYEVFNLFSMKNKWNLIMLSRVRKLYEIPELVMPISIIREGIRIKGYIMDYCQGIAMSRWLAREDISDRSKIATFVHLADVINQLPPNVFFGDLHGGNVLVEDDGSLHLIDIDGFSLKGGFMLNSPIRFMKNFSLTSKLRKYFSFGKLKISRNSDILCFFMLFLNWLSGDLWILSYESEEWLNWFNYLNTKGFPKEVLAMIHRLFEKDDNYLEPKAFELIQTQNLQEYTYISYVLEDGK